MSNYWDIACVDCGDVWELHANHAAEQIQELIAACPAIAAMGAAAPQLLVEVRKTFSIYGERGDHIAAAWVAKHAGHRLAPRSEYGYYAHECAKPFACSECGHWRSCKLPREHEGDCSAKRGE